LLEKVCVCVCVFGWGWGRGSWESWESGGGVWKDITSADPV
jgi:hypothetical protein